MTKNPSIGKRMNQLSLADALASGRLSDFVAQAEANQIGPADRAQFDKMVGRVTAPLPEGRTSIYPLAIVRPKSKLRQIAFHVLRADLTG
jgi:hypothetical protein